jgi:hypothetical protein
MKHDTDFTDETGRTDKPIEAASQMRNDKFLSVRSVPSVPSVSCFDFPQRRGQKLKMLYNAVSQFHKALKA